jgi:hypothetical protein
MAPNLKHVTLLSESLVNFEVIRPKEALNYTQQSKTVNNDNYWAWTSEPDRTADLFSADHLEANIIKDSQSKPSTIVTLQNSSSSDNNYWAEQDQDIKVESQPQHAEVESVFPVESSSYWRWSNEPTESDHYWSFNEPKQVVRNPVEFDSYWEWSNAATESDVYWSEATCHEPSDNY